MCLLKVLSVTGAEFFYPGFFNVTSGKGPHTFPDPRNYIWQLALPSYAQAITSRYETILRKGDLLRDSKGEPIVRLDVGDPRLLIAVRKHPNEDVYIISGTLQPNTNYKGNVKDKKATWLKFDGHKIRCEFRRQGSTYYLDLTKPDQPIFYQLVVWHEAGHPLYWRKDS